MTIDQLTEALADAQVTERRLKDAMRFQNAESVRLWREAPEGAEKAAHRADILRIDEALCAKNWLQIKWEAEGRTPR